MKLKRYFYHRLSLLVRLLSLLQGCGYSQAAKDTVCITRTGEKYHRCSCRYLRLSSFKITMDEATRRGYTACSVCNPGETEAYEEPASAAGVERAPVKAAPQNPVRQTQQKTTASRQCAAYTQSGSRCKRTTTSASGKCWQHE
jgi:hypothetical protein